jgi:hypothetical protein
MTLSPVDVRCHQEVKAYLRYAKFEEKLGMLGTMRRPSRDIESYFS